MEKFELLEKMYISYRAALEQKYDGFDSEIVRGYGDLSADIALVGEVSGANADGSSKNLEKFLTALSITREQLYITNAVKFRPRAVSPKTGKLISRTLTKDEIETSAPFLFEELKIVSPKLIVTLGGVSLKALTGDKSIKISELHGKRLAFHGLTIFPLFQPASVIYNQKLADTYNRDLVALKELINTN